MILLRLTWFSLLNRKSTLLLTILSISLSVVLLLGVDMVRHQAKEGFSSTVSGTDLIVGARSGQINLLLYSVFRIGNATNNISWQSYQAISQHPKVKWSIPLSLGDSHKGYRVLGTNTDYFKHYRYGKKQPLTFRQGQQFNSLYDVVLGAEVANKLGYEIGDKIVIAHGAGNVALVEHDDKPFSVVGILAPTGTPVDNTLHVSLQAIEAIHVDWKSGMKLPGVNISAEQAALLELQPKQITAFMLGLHSKLSTFHLQRSINQYRKEPLLAILPGLTLQELWQMFGLMEKALLLVSALVAVSSLIGLLTLMLTSLNERRREMAILRSVGARPLHIFLLLMFESLLITFLSIALGVVLFYALLIAVAPVLQSEFGLLLYPQVLTLWQWQLLGILFFVGSIVGLIPGYRAYKNSLVDGMAIRV
ncbi:FtsX-like permease family protein [Neptuniibacter sp.]|uniref:ABC transporter permease n=1 Tax=Neptuniibacter sp. TaxID=1962643 RepID=UPI00261332FA|nr:FtsX-like permease family protein [Neptuniibacter sp.]MCP4596302.1 FtsX-like permease family protein [Neptuniibacter sp.]